MSDFAKFAKAGGSWLFLDASGRVPCAAVWRDGTWVALRQACSVPATEALFALTDDVLKKSSLTLGECAGFLFVEGPGALLGIRIAAMAIRCWRALPDFANKRVFAMGTLELSAHLLSRHLAVTGSVEGQHAFTLLSDSRQGWWNATVVRDGVVPSGFNEIDAAGMETLPEPRFHIAQRNTSKPPPVAHRPFPENLLGNNPAVLLTHGLLRETHEPDAANHAGQFAKWHPGRHRA
ncbi:MAG: hypothetical protein LBD14_06780 [Puniceicoccales bacterium]|nr:hypothetical protein [Puniceicoccales bacterium]